MAWAQGHRRTNEEWVAALRGDLGVVKRNEAYVDLGRYLYRVAFNYLDLGRQYVPGLFNRSNDELSDLAEEFTQEVLLRVAHERLYNRFRDAGNFLAFVATITRREIGEELRRKGSHVMVDVLPEEDATEELESESQLPPLPAPGLGVQQIQELRELWEMIRQCLEHLPERWRKAFKWRVYDDMTTDEIRRRLDLASNGAVDLLVHRARKELKKCLKKVGWSAQDLGRIFSS